FEQGKKRAPCIIFIDEIDAVGRQRGAGLGGGHDEREQTLNALLVEMDGFETNEGVILIAATNRPDVLDPALLRPGRFDRTVVVDNPDLKGRIGILKVHSKKIPLDINIDLEVIARGCPGFSGADLENLMNEAALLAARKNLDLVTMPELEEAKDKVMMGPARKSLVINEKEKKNTAYHEAGHALVAEMIPGTDPLHKITIIPRGRALGATVHLPEEEKYSYPKEYWLSKIAILMGGRAAENIVFSAPTTGASNDIERATEIARKMVCEWGMSEKIGPVQFGKREEHPFLGRELAYHKDHSEHTGIELDGEIKRIVTEQYELAHTILTKNRAILDKIAELLLEKETIDGEEVRAVIRGEDVKTKEKENGENVAFSPLPVAVSSMNNIITYNVLGMMFEVNKTEMTESGQIAIDRIAKQIKDILTKESEKYSSKTPRIEILGYTDSLGTAEEKNRISLQRAQNVKKYIIEKFEIPENMLFAIGKADSEAIGDNALPDGRAKNRRVKILFIEPTAIEHSAKVIDGLVSKIKEKQN
ncbi:MAG TPA: AAA family ATPase, partial [bacterium]|nr:AAA family ATPase [bacterium]